MNEIRLVDLDCEQAGVAEQFRACLRDVMTAWSEQDTEERGDGDCKIVLTVTLARSGDGAVVAVKSDVKIPGRKAAEGCFAQVCAGKFVVVDAQQQELPGVEKVRPMRAAKEE